MNEVQPRGNGSIPLSLQKRVDEACDRFEKAWKDGHKPRIEDYLAVAAQPDRASLFRELLALEIKLRRNGGDRPTPEGYHQRFGDHSDLIRAVFANLSCASDSCPPGTSEGATTPEAPPPEYSAMDDGPPAPDHLGRYKVVSRLGGGTFGDVYLAQDAVMDRQVAIKVPSAWLVASERAKEEFLREARSVARLQYTGIVRAYDFGQEADGRCYIVYEFVDGESLAERIKPERIAADPLPLDEAVRIVADMAEALHYAHLQGMFHRDVKPANVLLDRQGRPKLADFGLAVREEDLADQRGILAGTLPYMSPEQVRREGHHLDGRTDIYSLGVMLYELICGRRPFEAKKKDELEDQILHREARPLRQIKDSIPAELEQVCLKALSKRINDRYTTAKDMAEKLRQLADRIGNPKRMESPVAPSQKDPKNLLHLIWDSLDSNLQDAFSLAYNKKRREGSNRISTRDLFQALHRISDEALRTLIQSLPEGALPDPIGADVKVNRDLLNAAPLLSDCVEDSLGHFIQLAPLPRKLSPIDIFVDIGQHGHGPSVARLRKHGVTPEELDKRIEEHGLSLVRRGTKAPSTRDIVGAPRQATRPGESLPGGAARFSRLLDIHQEGNTVIAQILCHNLSDDQTFAKLRAEFRALLEVSEGRQVILDLSNVENFASTALATLVLLWKKLRDRGGNLRLRGLNPSVAELLRTLRVDSIFGLEPPARTSPGGPASSEDAGNRPTIPPAATTTSFGPYILDKVVSSSGGSSTFLGHRSGSSSRVTLTVWPIESRAEEEQCLKEFHQLAKLEHAGVAKVRDFGAENGYLFAATDYLDGCRLTTWLGLKGSRPSWKDTARLIAAVAETLSYLHSAEIYHGDVKPANILMTRGESPVLLLPVPSVLRAAIPGTPAYMAPEQIEGRRIDGRADVYSLGVILYELLCGRPPFADSLVWERLRRVREDDPPPPRQLVPEVPRDLEMICLKAIAKRAAGRYPTAADLTADLRAWLADVPTTETPLVQEQPRAHATRWKKALFVTIVAAVILGGLLALRSFF